jgi:hypothetical protein
MRRRAVALLVALLLLTETLAWAGLGTHDAMYVGGTVAALKERTEGKAVIGEKTFVFQQKGSQWELPYDRINSLEYGQKAGRRVGAAIGLALINPVGMLMLFSKKRRHFLTIGYLDENKKQQAAVFELGKSTIRPTLRDLEAKTGQKVDFEDEQARKSGLGK